MKTKTLYYDAFLNGLIRVKYIGKDKTDRLGYDHAVKCLQDKGAYRKGETLYVPSRHLVNKTRISSSGHIMVKTADLSQYA